MDFNFTDEQILLADSLKEFLQRNITEADIQKWNETETFPQDVWQKFCDNGYAALGVPEEFGGTPADSVTQALAGYTVNKYGAPLAGFFTLGMTTNRDLLEFGTPEQQEMVMKPLLNGGTPMALGMSEPNAGSDVSGIQTSYVWDGDDVVINGAKHYNSSASQVKYILLLAKDATIENAHKAVTMFILPSDAPGVRITDMKKLGGPNCNHICEIFLDNVRLNKSMILGKEHEGFKQSMKNFELERTIATAAQLAIAENAYEDAATYATQRVQFGRTIGENQLIMELIFEMKMRVENIRNQLYKVAWMIDNKMDVRVEHALLKYYGSRAAHKIVDDALQVMGGLGLVGNHRIMRYYTDVRQGRIGAGSDQVMIFSTAPQILKKFK